MPPILHLLLVSRVPFSGSLFTFMKLTFFNLLVYVVCGPFIFGNKKQVQAASHAAMLLHEIHKQLACDTQAINACC